MSSGYVVEHRVTGIWYAVSPQNYNVKIHRKIRDLAQSESPRSFPPKRKLIQGKKIVKDARATRHPRSEGEENGVNCVES